MSSVQVVKVQDRIVVKVPGSSPPWQNGVDSIDTYALLIANLNYPDNALVRVTLDPTPSRNTYYTKSGAYGVGSWVRSLDPLTNLQYDTKAAMDADLLPGAGSTCVVTADPTPSKNTNYTKSGASGAGSWVRSLTPLTNLQYDTKVAMLADLLPGDGSICEVTNDDVDPFANNGQYVKSGVSEAGTWVASGNNGGIARALKFPSGETMNPEVPALAARAGKLLGFGVDGTPTAVSNPINVGAYAGVVAVTYAEAMLLTGLTDGQQVQILSRAAPLYGLANPFDGGGGTFGYASGDYSAYVAIDPLGGVYLPLASDPSGATGVLIRRRDDGATNVRWFGAKGDRVTDDYLAIQSALDFLVGMQEPYNYPAYNFSSGKLYFPNGIYCISQTLVNNVYQLHIVGDVRGSSEASFGGTTLTWIGSAGTVDDPIWMIDSWTFDEFYNPPAGVPPQARSVKVWFEHISFEGLSVLFGTPGYVSGIRLRQASFSSIRSCTFTNLYDGIVATGPQLFMDVAYNLFYGCYRDCLAVWRYSGDFSTTVWPQHNEFGFFGRYAILLDSTGSVDAGMVLETNSIEGDSASSPYLANPAHFYLGIPADILLVNCGGSQVLRQRFEAGSYRHNIHIAGGDNLTIEDNTFSYTNTGDGGAALAVTKREALNAAAATFLSEKKYLDITDVRNGEFQENTSYRVETLRISRNKNPDAITIWDYDTAMSTSGGHFMQSNSAIMYAVPLVGGVPDPATKTLFLQSNMQFVDCLNPVVAPMPGNMEAGISFKALASGIIGAREFVKIGNVWFLSYQSNYAPLSGFDGWAINNMMGTPNATPQYTEDYPLFFADLDDGLGNTEYFELGVARKRKIRYNYSAAPTTGTWKVADTVYNNAPAAGGYIGWVCVTAGSPGTWKGFGLIEA